MGSLNGISPRLFWKQSREVVTETCKNMRICALAKYFYLFTTSEKVKLLVY
jgi:hypothetical protein